MIQKNFITASLYKFLYYKSKYRHWWCTHGFTMV